MKVNKTPEIKQIVEACYPDYKGRKFSIQTYDPDKPFECHDNYWDGGTRRYWTGYNLRTGEHKAVPGQNPILNAQGPEGFLAEDVAIVEHLFFCGHDCGITIHVHPNNMAKLLPADTQTDGWVNVISNRL